MPWGTPGPGTQNGPAFRAGPSSVPMGRGAIGATRGPSRVGDGEQSATARPNRLSPALRHQVAAVEQLLDLALEHRLDLHPLLEGQVARLFLQPFAVQVAVLQVHLAAVYFFLLDVR